MNYKRWILVGFVAAIAIFSFVHLSTAGSDYKALTTSDSGYFYGIAREMNQQNGLIQEYELSHPPQGKNVPTHQQFQPLMLVTLYRGLNAINPNLSLMDVCMYFSPLLFALSAIGAFLAGREFGGDLAGCAAALFFSTLIGSIYWTKIGAFDREITLVFFGTWLFYLVGKIFNSQKIKEVIKYSAIAGIFYGFFIITWPGAPFLAAIIVATVAFIILERSVSGLGFALVGVLLFILGNSFKPFDISELLGLFFLLAGFTKIAMDWEAVKNIEESVISSLKSNWKTLAGIASFIIVSTVIGSTIGGYDPTFWANLFTDRIPSFIGLGGGGAGGVSFPRIATEQAPVPPELGRYFSSVNARLYANSLLTGLTVLFVAAGVAGILLNSTPGGLYVISWLLIVLPMPLSQARFLRLFWPMWPVLAGIGLGTLFEWGKDWILSLFSLSGMLEKFRKPILIAIVIFLLVVPFAQNARANRNSSEVQPVPHGGSLPTDFYHSLEDSFNWIENNTPEDSTVAIEWSYGHFATGAANRPSVTDGGQTIADRGEWQDSGGVKPPDYIRYVEGGEGYIIGKNAPIRENGVNGRRIDVRRLSMTGSEKTFANIVNTYRDNYDVKMDYIILNNSVSAGTTTRQELILGTSGQNMETTQNVKRENQDVIFNFQDENIIFNFKANPKTPDGESLGGVVYYNLDSRRLFNYSLNTSPDDSTILWVLLSSQEGAVQIEQNLWIQGAGKGSFSNLSLSGSAKIPMLIRALNDYGMPEYLEESYRSPHGQAVVYKILHENISEY